MFEWLFKLFSADETPERPALTEEDLLAIEKARVLLGSYSDDAAKSLMLGVLAAAKGDESAAHKYLLEAYDLDKSGPLLPLTMAAQVHVQEGNYKAAKILHERVLEEGQKSPLLQRINAHLDLAVACSELGETGEAKENIEKAKAYIESDKISASQKVFAYLQSGIVYKESFGDDKAALQAWKAGQELSSKAGSVVDARLALQLNMTVIENLPASDPPEAKVYYLKSAEQVTDRLSGESRIIAQLRLGEQYTKLAVDSRGTSDSQSFAREAQRLIAPAREFSLQRSGPEMIRVKAKAIEEEKKLAVGDSQRMGRLNKDAQSVKERIFNQQITRPLIRTPGRTVRAPAPR